MCRSLLILNSDGTAALHPEAAECSLCRQSSIVSEVRNGIPLCAECLVPKAMLRIPPLLSRLRPLRWVLSLVLAYLPIEPLVEWVADVIVRLLQCRESMLL